MTATDPAPDDTTTPTQRRKRGRRWNWHRIKADYVEGISDNNGTLRWPTFAEVAERNQVQPSRAARVRMLFSSVRAGVRNKDLRERKPYGRQSKLCVPAGSSSACPGLADRSSWMSMHCASGACVTFFLTSARKPTSNTPFAS